MVGNILSLLSFGLGIVAGLCFIIDGAKGKSKLSLVGLLLISLCSVGVIFVTSRM